MRCDNAVLRSEKRIVLPDRLRRYHVQRGSGDSPASLLETRPAATLAGFRANRPYSIIDTATPLAFVLIVR